MPERGIDFIGFTSLSLAALSVIGVTVLTFGPSQIGTETPRAFLMITTLVFSLLGGLAHHVGRVLDAQADEIASLRRELQGHPPV